MHRFSMIILSLNLWFALLAIPAQAKPFAYVANQNSNSVSVIDTASNTVVATVPVGSCPEGVAITPDGTRAYVPNTGSNSVSVIDTASNIVIATVGVGVQPRGVSITPKTAPAPMSWIGPVTTSP